MAPGLGQIQNSLLADKANDPSSMGCNNIPIFRELGVNCFGGKFKHGSSFQLPVIDASNKTGSMEFACGGNADDFFPVRVSFYSKKSYSEIQVCSI